jgi:hypothetical protein
LFVVFFFAMFAVPSGMFLVFTTFLTPIIVPKQTSFVSILIVGLVMMVVVVTFVMLIMMFSGLDFLAPA